MISFSLIHMMNGSIRGFWVDLSAHDLFMHWLTVFNGYVFAGLFVFMFTKSQFIVHEQFQTILKSKDIIKQLKRNCKIFFLVLFALFDFFIPLGLSGGIDKSGFAPEVSFLVIPSFVIAAFMVNFEIERLGIGPLLEAICESYERITGKNS